MNVHRFSFLNDTCGDIPEPISGSTYNGQLVGTCTINGGARLMNSSHTLTFPAVVLNEVAFSVEIFMRLFDFNVAALPAQTTIFRAFGTKAGNRMHLYIDWASDSLILAISVSSMIGTLKYDTMASSISSIFRSASGNLYIVCGFDSRNGYLELYLDGYFMNKTVPHLNTQLDFSEGTIQMGQSASAPLVFPIEFDEIRVWRGRLLRGDIWINHYLGSASLCKYYISYRE